jgi:hypothetical protein
MGDPLLGRGGRCRAVVVVGDGRGDYYTYICIWVIVGGRIMKEKIDRKDRCILMCVCVYACPVC